MSGWLLSALISSTIAGFVTITVSILVHFFGGIVGGALGTVPHVAVVGSIGFSLRLSTSSTSFQTAMLVMPIGMLINSFYLAALRIFSYLSWERKDGHLVAYRMTAIFGASGIIFLLLLTLVVFVLKPEHLPLATVRILAYVSFFAEFAIGIVLIVFFSNRAVVSKERGSEKMNSAEEKKEKRSSSVFGFLGRGFITFVLFFIALALAQTLPALSGILVNLPIVGTVVVSSLWISDSEEVALSTLAPMVLGMLSASLYAILASFFMPFDLVLGILLSWCVSVVFVTLPVVCLLEKLKKGRESSPKGQHEHRQKYAQETPTKTTKTNSLPMTTLM